MLISLVFKKSIKYVRKECIEILTPFIDIHAFLLYCINMIKIQEQIMWNFLKNVI